MEHTYAIVTLAEYTCATVAYALGLALVFIVARPITPIAMHCHQ